MHPYEIIGLALYGLATGINTVKSAGRFVANVWRNKLDPIGIRFFNQTFEEGLKSSVTAARGLWRGIRSNDPNELNRILTSSVGEGKGFVWQLSYLSGFTTGKAIRNTASLMRRGIGHTTSRLTDAVAHESAKQFVSGIIEGGMEAAGIMAVETPVNLLKKTGKALFKSADNALGFNPLTMKPVARELVFGGLIAGGIGYGLFQGWNDASYGFVESQVSPMSGTYGDYVSPYLNGQFSVSPARSSVDDLGADGSLAFALHNLR